MASAGTPSHSAPTPSSLSGPSPSSTGPAPRRQKRKALTTSSQRPGTANDNEPSISVGRDDAEARVKVHRVTRACDHCKAKKLRCTGTLPCANCTARDLSCLYEAAYRRGRPTTPPPASFIAPASPGPNETEPDTLSSSTDPPERQPNNREQVTHGHASDSSGQQADTSGRPSVSRASPDLEAAEIEGQYVDPTSNLTFLHRAWRRLASQNSSFSQVPGTTVANEEEQPQPQPMTSAGDRPFAAATADTLLHLDRSTASSLFTFYFEFCVVTYQCLHQPTVALWLDRLLASAARDLPLHTGLSHSRAAIILTIFAIATLRREKLDKSVSTPNNSDLLYSLHDSDRHFCAARALTEAETGHPTLESAQARLLQVLYLLQTSRMNQAWYVFGSTLPIVSALGLHRKSGGWKRSATSDGKARGDYIAAQCRKRTFWVAYTIDKYLAVVLGRPRLYHDDDVNQDFPDRVNDEDMTPQGPSRHEPQVDCHVDALIAHAEYVLRVPLIPSRYRCQTC